MNDNETHTFDAYNTRVLNIHYAEWRTSITAIDATTNQRLYTLSNDTSRSHYIISNANNQTIGKSKTTVMSSKIIIDTIDASTGELTATFEMRNDKFLGAGSPRYTSPVFGGQEVTWKNKAMSRDIIYTLIDGRGMALARFVSDRSTKIGKLEIVAEVVDEGAVSEIVVGLLTLLKRKMKAIETSTIAAVAAA